MSLTVNAHAGISALDEAAWNALSQPARVDAGHAFLRFRELLEPGPAVAMTLTGEGALLAATHGAVTTEQTAVLSHPWKMLTGEQFLRIDPQDGDGAQVRARHAQLVAAVTGASGPAAPDPAAMTRALGEVLVVRGFDRSELLTAPAVDRATALHAVLTGAQEWAGQGNAGAIALPFVDPDDAELRAVLAALGFQCARLTAATSFRVPACGSFEEYLATLPKRLRRRFRKEQDDLVAAGLELDPAELPEVLDRVVDLEIRTAERYGNRIDPRRRKDARAAMHALLGPQVRTIVVRNGDRIVACGIDLVDQQTYYGLIYGCDYDESVRATAYQCVCYHFPIRYAVENGLEQVRLGFEAWTPKLIRGADLDVRQTWIWIGDEERRTAMQCLLEYLDRRTEQCLQRLPVHRPRGETSPTAC